LADAEAKQGPGPFDEQAVRFLCRLMSRHDLSEMDLRQGDFRIRLRRGGRVRPAAPAPAEAAAPAAAAPPAEAAPAAPAKKLLEIKSPAVGIFYAQREPGSPPFVTVGSRVTPDTVVGLLEAMKIYDEIKADCAGTVVEALVTDKGPVEYNQVLFRVDPTGG
jgi:acetyl-CoA carboxylase biotin carboxyl carrier protein